ncbi:MAG: DNA adenine methylase [Ktedonobacterales bacterium]
MAQAPEVIQATLFSGELLPDVVPVNGIVNVATVPQLSPFRYPGGKTWLAPRIRQWLSPAIRRRYGLRPLHPTQFIEPFAGGGIIGLTVASERLAQQVVMVELDNDVAAVWQACLAELDSEWLARRMLTFELTPEQVDALLAAEPQSIREQAFQTIVRNRVNRGGILAPGAGRLKQGENGRGIRSRWYPATLARRIRHITTLNERILFQAGDGLQVIEKYGDDPDAVFFLDPPYTAGQQGKRAGSRLYTHFELDHERLFALASQLRGDVLMTYEDSEEVRSLAARHGFATRLIPMKNTHHARMSELLIGRSLDWV